MFMEVLSDNVLVANMLMFFNDTLVRNISSSKLII